MSLPPVGRAVTPQDKVPCLRCGRRIVYPPCNVCTLCLMRGPDLQPGER